VIFLGLLGLVELIWGYEHDLCPDSLMSLTSIEWIKGYVDRKREGTRSRVDGRWLYGLRV
jgi:hypothetical protein